MIHIPARGGLAALVDDQDAHLEQYKWFIAHGYAVRGFQLMPGRGGSRLLYMHHCIVGYPLKDLVADHINGNRLDNRRANLRFVDNRINAQNHAGFRNGRKTSRFLGVHWETRRSRWVSQIKYPGSHTPKFLGYFSNESAAAEAYLEELKKINQEVLA